MITYDEAIKHAEAQKFSLDEAVKETLSYFDGFVKMNASELLKDPDAKITVGSFNSRYESRKPEILQACKQIVAPGGWDLEIEYGVVLAFRKKEAPKADPVYTSGKIYR
ncbi:MAG: hypothetical protein E6R04_11420 [Spirochaetes bacterium]|nr:MAG: hypothetical protein E6R04_11420 [Spirochaetota bacterium]